MTTEEMVTVMRAYDDGKEIQFSPKGRDDWGVVCNPRWNWNMFDYRVKPEPQYVPYDSVSEVEKDKWIKNKIDGRLYRIEIIDMSDDTVCFGVCGWKNLNTLFHNYIYEDGAPCGKKVE